MKTLSILAVLLLCGCANISHNRQVVTENTDTNGIKTVKTTKESESARFFFQREAADKVFTSTTDSGTNYTHRVGATNVQATGDVDLVKAVGEAVSSSLGAAAKSAVKP